jgi:dCTP deaminase
VSIRPDTWISRMAREHGLIEPFEPAQVRSVNGTPVVSFGLSSFGYDVRVADEFRVFTNIHSNIVDPKAFDARGLHEFKGPHCDIPPNSFALGITVEKFRIPLNVLTLCVGKSTYARCGIIVNVTPFEPGWEGRAVLEISNSTPLPARIYAFEGIAQVIFFESQEPCGVSYAQRQGKYQGQQQITFPKV